MDWTLKRLRRGRTNTEQDAEAKQRALSRWEGEGGSSMPSKLLAGNGTEGARRAELGRQIERLEAEVRANIDALGHDVHPLFEAGSLTTDVPAVRQRLAAIAAAQEDLRAAQAEQATLAGTEPAE